MSKVVDTGNAENRKRRTSSNKSQDMISSFMQISLKDARTDAHIRKKIEFFRKNYPKLERMTDKDSLAYRHLSQTCSLLARQILQDVQAQTNSQTRH